VRDVRVGRDPPSPRRKDPLRVLAEFQCSIEPGRMRLRRMPSGPIATRLSSTRCRSRARTVEARLAKSDALVGAQTPLAAFVINARILPVQHALLPPAGAQPRARFVPVAVQYLSVARVRAR
jgi:hypothetical protein